MPDIEIGELTSDDIPTAVGLCARAFRDTPTMIGMYGPDPLNRLTWNHSAFGAVFGAQTGPSPLAARYEGILLGVCVTAPSEHCIAYLGRLMREQPPDPAAPPESARLRDWVLAVTDHDPDETHVHVGPIAVEVDSQGMGIGSRLLEVACAGLGERGQLGWLETDEPRKVALYERYGFEVVADVEANGQPNWFMRREPGA